MGKSTSFLPAAENGTHIRIPGDQQDIRVLVSFCMLSAAYFGLFFFSLPITHYSLLSFSSVSTVDFYPVQFIIHGEVPIMW
jgi:hypothetical protein